MRIPAERKRLESIREFIQAQAALAGPTQHQIDDLIQAVDEAATNIIVHGYQDGPGMIEVEFERLDRMLRVTLRDQAPTFDPDNAPVPDLNLPLQERPVGGLGIFLIRKCVDELIHRVPAGGGNELILVKRLD